MTGRMMVLVAALSLMVTASAGAQTTKTGGQVDPLDGPDVKLGVRERYGVRLGREWADSPDFPARGKDGSVVFLYGAALPGIVCAPLYVCDLALEAGENVNDLHIGDGVRWQVTPAIQGSGKNATTHIMIKPTAIGLTTNLVIITDRRSYTIKLISRRKDWMPRIAFFYPESRVRKWKAYRRRQRQFRAEQGSRNTAIEAARLDFSYSMTGDHPSWRPRRVYAAGEKTIIEFPRHAKGRELPVLVVLAGDGGLFTPETKQLVNYRYVNGRFVVDQILDRAALISGTGRDQKSVTIIRRKRP